MSEWVGEWASRWVGEKNTNKMSMRVCGRVSARLHRVKKKGSWASAISKSADVSIWQRNMTQCRPSFGMKARQIYAKFVRGH